MDRRAGGRCNLGMHHTAGLHSHVNSAFFFKYPLIQAENVCCLTFQLRPALSVAVAAFCRFVVAALYFAG